MSLPSRNFKKLELFYQSSNQLEEFKKRKQNHNNKKNPNGGMQQPETTEMAGKCYRTSTRNEFVEILRGFCYSLQGDSSDHSQGHQNSEKLSIYSPLSTVFSPFPPFFPFFFLLFFSHIISPLLSPLCAAQWFNGSSRSKSLDWGTSLATASSPWAEGTGVGDLKDRGTGHPGPLSPLEWGKQELLEEQRWSALGCLPSQ